uniref:ATP synthase F0 subunit 8 n=1 Tax=Sternocampsus coriaceus TaxID=3041292 RepID=UPI002551F49F|nr:ATP synthase F0 subunit 8 [Sternocampsus coriaceus]WGF20845.1 ATP synthase F0 subunit 8 [Sternocampsus coriaceus]
MPQMAPLSWLNLFIMFIIIFLMLNTLNYFSFNYYPKTSKTTPKLLSTNWKW